jgi:hypothetical protein
MLIASLWRWQHSPFSPSGMRDASKGSIGFEKYPRLPSDRQTR